MPREWDRYGREITSSGSQRQQPPIEVEAPDGTIVEFPAGTPQETMRAAMAQRWPAGSSRRSMEEQGDHAPAARRYEVIGPGGAVYALSARSDDEARARVREHLGRQAHEANASTMTLDQQRALARARARVRRAELHDGTVLEFPENTSDEVIDRTVRSHLAQSRPPPQQARAELARREFERRSGQAPRTPSIQYQRAYAREERLNNPRQSALSRNTNFAQYWPDAVGFGDELAGGAAFVGQGAENLIRRATGRPIDIPAGVAGQAAMDQRRDQYARFRREQPGQNIGANVMGFVAGAGSPAMLPRMGMLRAGATAAAVNAPFALARQEGSLPERIPGAARETALVGVVGGGLQGLANGLGQRATRAGSMVSAADRAGVAPSMALANGGGMSGALTKMVGDNVLAGALVRPRIRQALTQTRDAAQRLSSSYGAVRDPEAMGAVVQRGLERYARNDTLPSPSPNVDPSRVSTRDWSFAAKARAVFDHVLRPIEGNAAALNSTERALQSITRVADSDAVRSFRQDPVLREFTQTLSDLRQTGATLRDLRELRRRVRLAQDTPALGQTLDNAALQRIEAALTEDIYQAAGPAAANLRRADSYYLQGRQRIHDVLRSIDPNASHPGQVYSQILRWASERSPDSRALSALRNSLRDDEWRTVAASMIDRMGEAKPGASGFNAELGFSVEGFATAWRSMTPQARRILFGGASGSEASRLFSELENLANVAERLKGVQAMANFSGSGRDVNNYLTFGGAVMNLPATLATTASMMVTGEMLTNPAFVRWLASAARPNGGAGGVRGQLSALAQIASRDPAVAPLYTELLDRYEDRTDAAPPTREWDAYGRAIVE